MALLEEGQIQIHTENIFPIIKKAVYSGHEVFLRELISNALDAINKRRMASMAGDCINASEPKINISINRELMQITISDNGIGMTAEEVKKYINQVAFSSAEEFLSKYKQEEEAIIGHFGLGFYSSFMVAKNVEIHTKSALNDAKAVHWSCDGSPNFKLVERDKDEIGTDIILHLQEEEQEYIEPSRIKTLVSKYCDFMPIDIFLESEKINKKQALWRDDPTKIKDEEYIELYKYLYPFQGDPLIWIHLKTDYPYNLQGILFFPKQVGRADWEKGDISLFCNQVFVSDSIKEIVPRYLLPLRGVIDSPDIPLNVSRSALQTDRRVRSIGNFISKKVSDKLKSIRKDNPDFFIQAWEELSPFVKIGAMEDDKFADNVKDLIFFKTIGEIKKEDCDNNDLIYKDDIAYTSLSSYRIRNKKLENKVIYCSDQISQKDALELWKSQDIEILIADTVIDTQFIPWLESNDQELNFTRVDSELDDSIKDDVAQIANSDGDTDSEKLRITIKESLANEKVTVQVQKLKNLNAPPAIILLPEQMRRMNDIGALMDQRLPGLPENHVLVINEAHPLVKGLLKIKASSVIVTGSETSPSASLAKDLARHIYELALLGVGGLEPSDLRDFQTRSAKLLSELINQ